MKVTKTISSEDTFSDKIATPENQLHNNFGRLLLILDGLSDSTVTLQCSIDGGSTWYDVKSFTSNTVEDVFLPSINSLARVGIKTGDYGSDSVDAILSK